LIGFISHGGLIPDIAKVTNGCTGALSWMPSSARRQRIVAGLSSYVQVGNIHFYLDVTVRACLSWLGLISQRILVASFAGSAGIRCLDGFLREFGEHFAPGPISVLGQQVVVPLSRKMELGELLVNRKGGGIRRDTVDADPVGEQNFQSIRITRIAAHFASI